MRVVLLLDLLIDIFYYLLPALKLANLFQTEEAYSLGRIQKDCGSIDLVTLIS
jgi:hypothetical protein